MSTEVNWQGSFDAFCGVYCAAHVIASAAVKDGATLTNFRTLYKVRAEKAFGDLLGSLEDMGLLKASKIALASESCGYKHQQLERMINRLDESRREGLSAIAFSRAPIKTLTNSQRRNIISNGAYAIIQQNGKDHWIAVDAGTGAEGYQCFDPHPDTAVSSRSRISWSNGLFVGDPSLWKA